MKLAVYGTLKSGFSNESVMTDLGCIKVDTQWIEGFKIFCNGFLPYMERASEQENAWSLVEIYEVPDSAWGYLDKFESNGFMYDRTEIQEGVFVYLVNPLHKQYLGDRNIVWQTDDELNYCYDLIPYEITDDSEITEQDHYSVDWERLFAYFERSKSSSISE